jgi:hypothetical protein
MPAKPITEMKFDPAVVNQLACPACYGKLLRDDTRLICTACGRAYPIIDGIPVLIGDRSEAAGAKS